MGWLMGMDSKENGLKDPIIPCCVAGPLLFDEWNDAHKSTNVDHLVRLCAELVV